ncbi:MAG: DeoR/GlpR transcriptional regulator [Bacteroidales bacterium]|nr:DeoR/GlpR transcriptional regulator [Bacteroidales bacterium]
MEENSKHATVDRREKILNMLSLEGKVYVHELSKKFNVSEVTIRNDLDQLESKRQLIRARGGAMKLEGNVAADIMLSDKNKLNYKEKARIGAKAASLINDSDTIILDSGTTTSEIARNISNIKNLSIITNAINIVNIVAQHQSVNIIIPGGYLRKNSLSLVGPLAEKNLRNFFVDKAFIGVDGLDSHTGAYTPNIEEAHLNEIMISIAKEVIIVADSSKFKRKSLAFICPLEKITTIITDDGISPEDQKRLSEKGINVIIA